MKPIEKYEKLIRSWWKQDWISFKEYNRLCELFNLLPF